MFSPLVLAVSMAVVLTQPGPIVTESELPPPRQEPGRSTPESPAPSPEGEKPTAEIPNDFRSPEVQDADEMPEAAQEPEADREARRRDGRVLAFWMVAPDQANP